MRRMYDKEEIKEIAAESGSKIDSLDLVVGQPTVTYDTTDGITIESTGKLNGTDDIVVSNEIPIVAGEGISIDKAADKEQILIKNTASVDTSNFVQKSGIPEDANNLRYQTIAEGDSSPSRIFIYDTSTNNNDRCGAGLILYAKSNYNNTPFISIGTIGSSTPTGYQALHNMNPNAYLDNSSNNYITISNYQLIGVSGTKRYKVTFPVKDGTNEAVMCTNKTLKTLFGKETIFSMDGSGNIDLYCHNISFSDKVYFTAVSSNNLQIDSLTDLQTVFVDDVWKSASGTSADGTKQVVALNPQQMKVRYTDSTESSLAEYEAPVDTVTTI